LAGRTVVNEPAPLCCQSVDSHTRLLLEKKDDMRRRGAPSPDEWDAVALTFAEPVGAGAGFFRKLTYPEIGVV
jgi:hypothetical protein